MEEMGELNHHSKIASKDMCTFLILNVSSFQLIPVNMIAYRSQYGSANPTAILGPAMIATFFSTLAGIIFSKVMYALPQKQSKAYSGLSQRGTGRMYTGKKQFPTYNRISQAEPPVSAKKKKGGIFH